MNRRFFPILRAGLWVGTLDITAAFLYYFLRTGSKDVFNVLKYVASGFFGKEATTGGLAMIIAGLILHYCIAFAFTLFFFWIFPTIAPYLRHKLVRGIVYGLFVWSVMNLVVVPLSQIGSRPFNPVNALINLLILIICIGIPLSFMADRYYRSNGMESTVVSAKPEALRS